LRDFYLNEAVQKNTDMNIDSSELENQYLYLYFFMGRSPKRSCSESCDGVARLHFTAVMLRGAIWRLTRLRRSASYAEVPHERVKRQ